MKKLAVITGGTKGIGKALIEKFADQQFDIITCSRNEEDLKELSNEVSSKFGVSVHTFKVDMSKKNQVLGFVDDIAKISAHVDVLINNAGLFIPGAVHEEEDGALEQMIDTNLYSAYHLTRGLIHGMKSEKSGHIFNICSTASFVPYVNGGSYCISKFAMLGMSKVLREEMKEHNVRVTSIMPGATFTASWEGADVPEERFMKSEDVADAVFNAYTMSDRTVIEEIVMRPQLGDL
ncbi:SDR family oxidoreductase [Fulvivirga lutimaris]|uniref:SDR family oxidoreductase n=1 Tax=Fulvivirga lutimaris TaxID=1819566 RepID=UPI0012BD2212|nr:SDR family oxidoreductase [Fulvivirga lutimaris]MTI41245.1 SDR family oxidoreductase [Fulvivirga lutimaris]